MRPLREFFDGSGNGIDGRNLDLERTVLAGEGAQQVVKSLEGEYPVPEKSFPVEKAPSEAYDVDAPTYYGLPLLKDPVWVPSIAAYFYVGGVAGGSAAIAAAARAAGGSGLDRLATRCTWLAAGGGMLGTALLIHDLGRPTRFLNMLRVFRPTSPMNMGSWILAAFGSAAGAAAVFGPRTALGRSATYGAGLLGPLLSTYTAALIANTAVPVWQGAHRTLPLLFATSSATSTASLLQLFPQRGAEARAVRTLAIAGKAAELVAARAVAREVGRVKRAARPLHRGLSGGLWKAAEAMTAASLALDLFPVRRPWMRQAAGALGTAAALALRFSVYEQGKASTRDARAVADQQRAG